MVDHLRHLRSESQRFGELADRVAPGADVPSCPEWNAADLVWHLAEVQHFWASIVSDRLDDPAAVVKPERPADADLPRLFHEQSVRLYEALATTPPETACWTWHVTDHTAGFVRRRQAHEALIHRVDAELAAAERTDIEEEFAADGIDELLRVMIDGFPAWSTFTHDGVSAAITETHRGASWGLAFGRFTGTSPNTGNTYDLDALTVVDAASIHPTLRITGPAAAIDLWLWGRGDTSDLHVEGDETLLDRIRAIALESTQ